MMPSQVIDRLFSRLQGIYGTSFTSKFSTGAGDDGRDRGFENAKAVWSDELSGFSDNLDALAYALRNTDPKFPPSAREFLTLCRAAPRKEAPVLAHKLTPEESEHNRQMASEATKALKPKISDGIDVHWATHPRSEMQLKFIFDAAKKDARFAPCIAQMIEQGICTEAGNLLKRYRDGQFA